MEQPSVFPLGSLLSRMVSNQGMPSPWQRLPSVKPRDCGI
jgi:hypothetical protein